MSKALELIRTLIDGANEYEKKTGNTNPTVYLSKNNLLVIEKALNRLEAIDNANPSEALECLEQFLNEMTRCLENPKEYVKGYEKQIFWKYKNTLETIIKQALLKAQYHNSTNIFKGSKKVKIEIPESSLMDYNPVDKSKLALEIIKEKNVDVHWIKIIETLEEYNDGVDWWEPPLTEEEFNLLKEILE